LAEALRTRYELAGEEAEQILAAARTEPAGVLPGADFEPLERWRPVASHCAPKLVDNG
jgi:hypothetical protein